MSKKVIIEALKEFGRVILLAIIPVLITSIEQGYVDLKVIGIVGLLAGLRFLDKLLYEADKALPKKEQSDTLLKGRGITGF